MESLSVALDGQVVPVTAHQREGDVWVPLEAFCDLIGAEAKQIDGGPFAVCRGDLCIPLNVADARDTVWVDDTLEGRLEAFGGPLALTWQVSNGVLSVVSKVNLAVGLGVGDRPPPFTLADLYTGQPVSLSDFRGKKTAFYMWASW